MTRKKNVSEKLEKCTICGKKIRVMIFRGSGVCGETCRKKRAKEENVVRATTESSVLIDAQAKKKGKR